VRKGEEITVEVSRENLSVVPEVIGATVDVAIDRLRRAGFEVQQQPGDEVPRGTIPTVTNQSVAPGQKYPKGSVITITVTQPKQDDDDEPSPDPSVTATPTPTPTTPPAHRPRGARRSRPHEPGLSRRARGTATIAVPRGLSRPREGARQPRKLRACAVPSRRRARPPVPGRPGNHTSRASWRAAGSRPR